MEEVANITVPIATVSHFSLKMTAVIYEDNNETGKD